ncbi:MAG: hypothetical protein HY042_09405, partial [Spirochaetia bacterium]|nr:hypothetical protein [Spirochaetia bacterium]
MQRRYTLMGRVPAVILLMSLAAWPMSSEAQNRRPRGDSGAGTSDPVDQLPDSSDNKDDKGSSSRIL